MPELIIEPLEVIRIEHEYGERVAGALRPRQLALERFLEEAPVIQAGEMVANGLVSQRIPQVQVRQREAGVLRDRFNEIDRKSTRLNSSHLVISYAVFCLKKKT